MRAIKKTFIGYRLQSFVCRTSNTVTFDGSNEHEEDFRTDKEIHCEGVELIPFAAFKQAG